MFVFTTLSENDRLQVISPEIQFEIGSMPSCLVHAHHTNLVLLIFLWFSVQCQKYSKDKIETIRNPSKQSLTQLKQIKYKEMREWLKSLHSCIAIFLKHILRVMYSFYVFVALVAFISRWTERRVDMQQTRTNCIEHCGLCIWCACLSTELCGPKCYFLLKYAHS